MNIVILLMFQNYLIYANIFDKTNNTLFVIPDRDIMPILQGASMAIKMVIQFL